MNEDITGRTTSGADGERDDPTLHVPDSERGAEGESPSSAATRADGAQVAFTLGPFRILGELGRGGMGIVYLAQDPDLKRRVALKVLPQGFGASPDARARFQREAEVASRFDHPNLCGVLRVGETDGRCWIAMRYVAGRPLDAVLRDERMARPAGSAERRTGTAEVTRALELIETLARAMHVAHESGVVHRDLKPGNVMITETGEPVILDFGLAHELESDGPELTRSGDVLGTPYYMAPEQIRGQSHRADRRADVWALGIMLHQLVAGRRPFEGPTRDALYRSILTQDPPRLKSVSSAHRRDLQTVIDTALAKDPDRRYATARDLADDLKAVREIRPIKARPTPFHERVAKFARRRPAVAALLALLAVGIPIFAWQASARAATERRLATSVERGIGMVERALEDRNPAAAARELEALDDLPMDPARRRELERRIAHDAAREHALVLALEYDADPDGSRALAAIEALPTGTSAERAEDLVIAAIVARRAGRIDEAARRLDALEAVAPGRAIVLRRALIEGDAEALDYIEAEAVAPDLLALTVMGQPVRALAALEAALELEPRAHWLAWLAAEQATRFQSHHAALAHAGRARALLGELSPRQKARYSVHLRRAGLTERALKAAREAAEALPEDAIVRLHLASAYSELERTDDAIREYERALELDPGLQAAWTRMAAVYVSLLDYPEAERCSRRAVELDPDDPDARLNLGTAVLNQGRLDEAEAELGRAVELRPVFPFAWNALGVTMQRRQRFEEALANFDRAIEQKPRYDEAIYNKGTVYKDMRDIERALACFEEARRINPKMARAWTASGTAMLWLERTAEAETAFRRAIELDPRDEQALTNLAMVVMDRGELGEAIALGRQAHEADPTDVVVLRNLSSAYMLAGDLETSSAVVDAILALEPANAPAMMTWSVTLGDVDPVTAIAAMVRLEDEKSPLIPVVEPTWPEVMKSAAAMAPGHPLTLAREGLLARRDGDVEKAQALYERAVAALTTPPATEIPRVGRRRDLVAWATPTALAALAEALGRAEDAGRHRAAAAPLLEPVVQPSVPRALDLRDV